MSSWKRIGLALLLGFVIAFIFNLINQQGFTASLRQGFFFALLVGEIVAVLSWGMEIAEEKGYPGWLGFVLSLFLNVVGLIILVLIPANTRVAQDRAVK